MAIKSACQTPILWRHLSMMSGIWLTAIVALSLLCVKHQTDDSKGAMCRGKHLQRWWTA